MALRVGVMAAEQIAVGVVDQLRIVDRIHRYPGATYMSVHEMPVEEIVHVLAKEINAVAKHRLIEAIGVGFPGIVRHGIIEESPNLPQAKGADLEKALSFAFRETLGGVPIHISNDADAVAAGLAATVEHLDRLIRVWTLGTGIGFGRYPATDSICEGGHMTVSLDPNENYCGCGGLGHLEGIMGTRAMRLRFLDIEPEDIFFAAAKSGDQRYSKFVRLWHQALAAATAATVHIDGPGEFFITGPNARYINVELLDQFVSEMVTMSPLQANSFHVVQTSDEVGVIGAAVNASAASQRATSLSSPVTV